MFWLYSTDSTVFREQNPSAVYLVAKELALTQTVTDKSNFSLVASPPKRVRKEEKPSSSTLTTKVCCSGRPKLFSVQRVMRVQQLEWNFNTMCHAKWHLLFLLFLTCVSRREKQGSDSSTSFSSFTLLCVQNKAAWLIASPFV